MPRSPSLPAYVPDKRLPPPEQLRAMLARRRARGEPFDHAWAQAIRLVRWPHDTEARQMWQRLLREEQRENWRLAYEREPDDPAVAACARLVATVLGVGLH